MTSPKKSSKTFTEEEIRKLIFHHLAEPPDMIELQKSIIQWAVDLLQADAGEIFLWDSSRNALVLTMPTRHTQQYTDKYEGVLLQPGEGLAGRVFQELKPMVIENYYDWEGRSPIFIVGEGINLHSVMALPMIWQEKPIGVLTIDVEQNGKKITEDDIRLAILFSNIAAVSIMNARLYAVLQEQTREIQNALQQEVEARTAELQKHTRQINLSVQVSREITSILSLDRLLSQVVNLINSTFGYYCVRVFLTDQEPGFLSLKSASGEFDKKSHQHQEKVPVDTSSLNGRAGLLRKLVVVNDVTQLTDYQHDDLLPLTRSELVIPLQMGDQLLGTLDVHSKEVNAFGTQETLMLQSLSDQVAVAIQNSYFYERSKEIAVLEERNRLARELHDSVTQSLFSMDLHAKAIETYIEKDLQKAREQLQELRLTTHDTLQEMRSLIYDLRPISFKEIGLLQALKEQIERLNAHDVEITFQSNCQRSLPDVIEMCLFRVGQEALRNAVKHATASEIRCTLECADNQVMLRISDNGRGFDPKMITSRRQSFGILGMRERVELLQGVFTVESQQGKGTTVTATIPT